MGLVSGACLAEVGHHVMCVDVDPIKIDNLQKGILPIWEPGLEVLVSRNLKEGRLSFTTDAALAVQHGQVQFIAVGTPPDEDGGADMKYVMEVAESIAINTSSYKVIVNKSTVPVGTADKVISLMNSVMGSQLDDGLPMFDVVSNPEFLKEGAAVNDFLKPDRIIIGTRSERAKTIMRELYEPFNRNNDRAIFMDIRSAELTKYAANAMLATKISFMNEVANMAELLGADIEEVRKGIGSDPRIGYQFIYPGCGYGGSCFPKDVTALKQLAGNTGYSFQLLASVIEVNELQKRRVIGKLQDRLGSLRGRRVALLGLAFKPHTDDMREASSIVLASRLIAEGASVVAFDPVAAERARGVLPEAVEIAGSMLAAVTDADAVVIVTEWPEFRAVLSSEVHAAMRGPLIVDGRNLLDPSEAVAAGFTYVPIGRAERDPERELHQA